MPTANGEERVGLLPFADPALFGRPPFLIFCGLLSALLLSLSFPPLEMGLLAWPALVPLLVAVRSARSWRGALLAALAAGVPFHTGALSFLCSGYLFGLAGPFLANLLTVYLVIFALALKSVERSLGPVAGTIAAPFLWLTVEYFRAECAPLAFSWLSLGYSQHWVLPVIQSARLIGVHGVSFLIVLVASLIALAVTWPGKTRWRLTCFSLAYIVFTLNLVYGAAVQPRPRRAPFLAAACQRRQGNYPGLYSDTRRAVARGARLVVWPEMAIPGLRGIGPAWNRVRSFAASGQALLVVGSNERAQGREYNVALVFGEAGEPIHVYRKQALIPFLETALFAPGEEPGVFITPLGNLGVCICFDASFSRIPLRTVRSGAEFLAVPTYDPLEVSPVILQHHAAVIPFRALETGRYIVRAATHGISMIVDPSGGIHYSLGRAEEGMILGQVRPVRRQTPFARIGYLLPLPAALVSLLFLAAAHLQRRRRRLLGG